MTNIFDINSDLKIDTYEIDNSCIYFIDNFYKNPKEVVNLLNSTKCDLHKPEEKPSLNGIHFEDKRHEFKHDGVDKV